MRDRKQLRLALLAGALVLVATPLWAQAPPAPAPSPSTDSGLAPPPDPKTEEILQQAAQGDEQTLSAAGFTYDPKGRRDPFESIFDRKKDNKGRPTGIRGMEISELDLQGIVLSGSEKFAIVSGTDNKGYNLREGDELFNGKVKTIEKDRVVFLQKVNDPLSIKEYTEVAKRLNPEDR